MEMYTKLKLMNKGAFKLYKFRPETAKDIPTIQEVNDLAFGGGDESTLIEAIRQSDIFIPELSLVAETDQNEIIGHILFSPITIESGRKSVPSLALAPMAVKPPHQKKGIGSSLVNEGLKRCRELGYESVVVLGHSEYYPRFGFEIASNKGIQAPFDVPDEAFMVIELIPRSLENVQGTVKYSEPFTLV